MNVFKHAYYLAYSNTLCGDLTIGADLRDKYLALNVPVPQRYEGVSRIIWSDGSEEVIYHIRDFFNEKLAHFTHRERST